ncbi:MAG: TraB/GumN family protein [Chitinophagaceae bacterium]
MSPARAILILLFFFSSFHSFSQTAKANTLLWRITGNALAQPSYLFGTMHVTDKKAFHFQDSLYRFIEAVDAFAMELHPDSMTALTFDYLSRNEEELDWDGVLGKQELKQLEQQLDKAAKKLPPGTKSAKLKFLLAKLMDAGKGEKDGMNTFMDAYLYEVARRHTKEVHGLEQVADQLVALRMLPHGLQVSNFLKLLEKWNPSMASPIHELYYKEDIEQMEGFYRNIFTDTALQVFLYDRNAVMVAKMDSLMKGKTLFTAVGAGHLAGSKGVIALLRQKGYQVEPVFSANRIQATDYRLKEASLDWPVQQNSNHGFAYSMPGTPKVQGGQNGNEVAIHFDMGNGLTYMVVSGVLAATEKESELATAKKHLNQFLLSTSGKIIKLDTILVNGKPTLEALCKASDNSHFRFREMVQGHMFFVFTLSGRNKEVLYQGGADHFFSSYKTLPATSAVWSKNNYSQGGFEVALPVPLKVEDTKLDADAAGKISWQTYNAFDYRSAVVYTLYTCKALAGNELLDGYFFEHFINNIQNNTDGGAVQVRDTMVAGFPAKSFTSAPFNGIVVKGLIVERLNYSYYISAEYNHAAAEKDVDRFLASFALQPFEKVEWKEAHSPGKDFSVWAPGPVQLSEADVKSEEDETIFYSYDSSNAENYLVTRKRISRYLWADNRDSVYNYWTGKNITDQTDTIVYSAAVVNASLPARELLLKNKKTGILSKVRLLLDGDHMYELRAVLPPMYADTANIHRFFQTFAIAFPKAETPVLTNDPRLLFMDLQLENDAYFTNAYNAIDELPFSAKELPLLIQQILQDFPQTAEGYEPVNVKLLYKLQQVLNTLPGGKDSILQFVKQHYHQLDTAVQAAQFAMLDVLASDDRAEAYGLIKELLQQRPAKGYPYSFFYTLNNNPVKAATLFPLLYQYAGDSVMGASVLALANHLLDSGYISKETARTRKSLWLQLLNLHLKTALKDEHAEAIVFNLLELAGKLKIPELNAVVAKYVPAKNKWIKLEAVDVLVKSGQPVPAAALQTLAGDKYFRAELYRKLKEEKKSTLFPVAYRSQKSMAESYIYQSLKDDEEVESEPKFIYIKTIEHLYKGEKRRFFLFRLNMDESEEVGDANPTSLLGIAGPFNLDANQVDINNKDNVSGVYYESNFDGMRLDAFFKRYLQPFTKRSAE